MLRLGAQRVDTRCSGDTTLCKVTPVILHGVVSPETLPVVSRDAVASERVEGWLATTP